MNVSANAMASVPATGANTWIARNVANYSSVNYGGPNSHPTKHGSISKLQAKLYCTAPCTYNGYWTGAYTLGWLVNFCNYIGSPSITDIYHHGDPYDWLPTSMYRYTWCYPTTSWHWVRDWCANVKGVGYQAYHHANTCISAQVHSCNTCPDRIKCGTFGMDGGSQKWGTGWTYVNNTCQCGGAIPTHDSTYTAFVTYYGAGACYNDTTYNYARLNGQAWRTCLLYTPGSHWRSWAFGQPQGYCTGSAYGGPTGGECVMATGPKICTGSSSSFGIGACMNHTSFPNRAFQLDRSLGRNGQLTCSCSTSLWSSGLGFWGNYYYNYGYADFNSTQ